MSENKLWVFQDESGDAAKSDFFITGALCITSVHKHQLLQRIQTIRQHHRMSDELHSSKMSSRRLALYKDVASAVLDSNMFFKAMVVRKERIELERFGRQRHIAYNFFTRLLIQHAIKHRESRHVHIRVDDKNRLQRDNFLDYILNELNIQFMSQRRPLNVRSVKPRDSGSCEMLQVCDLLLGSVRERYAPAGGRKGDFSAHVNNHLNARAKVNIWDWEPNR